MIEDDVISKPLTDLFASTQAVGEDIVPVHCDSSQRFFRTKTSVKEETREQLDG